MNNTKPAVKSLGIRSGGIGLVSDLVILLGTVGVFVPEPVTVAVAASVSIATRVLGVFGRARAKQRIEGLFS